jgi:Holliday junction resolvase RusA-like endonuclease
MEQETVNLNIKPFSVNDAWKGRRFRTDAYDNFENYVMLMLPNTIAVPKEVPLRLTFWFGVSSKASDYDNPIKPMQDILQKAYEFDDKWIFEGKQFKEIVPKGQEYIRFKLEPIS